MEKKSLLIKLALIVSLATGIFSTANSQNLNPTQIGDFNGEIRFIVYYDSNYWIVGDFTMVNATTACTVPGWAVTDGTNFLNLPLTAPPGNTVTAINTFGNHLVIGGSFDNSWPDDAILKYNSGTWSALQGTVSNGPALATIKALKEFSGKLYVGGTFSHLKGTIPANHIAAWDGTDWSVLRPDTLQNPGVAGSVPIVHDFELYDGKLAIGGRFGSANGLDVDKVVLWDGTSFSSTRNAVPTGNVSHTGVILDLCPVDTLDALFALGSFSSIEGEPVPGFAMIDVFNVRWDITAEPDFVWDNNGNIDANQADMEYCGGELWVAGSLHGALGVDLEKIFRYKVGPVVNSWSTFDPQHKGMDAPIHDMLVEPMSDILVIGGAFSTIYGYNGGSDIQKNRLIRFDCMEVTSSESEIIAEPIEIFPNPASSLINIKCAENISSLEIADLSGRVFIQEQEEFKSEIIVNVSELPSGIYFAKVIGRNYFSVKKFTIQ